MNKSWSWWTFWPIRDNRAVNTEPLKKCNERRWLAGVDSHDVPRFVSRRPQVPVASGSRRFRPAVYTAWAL